MAIRTVPLKGYSCKDSCKEKKKSSDVQLNFFYVEVEKQNNVTCPQWKDLNMFSACPV